MRRIYTSAVNAIQFITNDEGENPDFLLFPATVPDSAINIRDGYDPIEKPSSSPIPPPPTTTAPSVSNRSITPKLPPVFKPPVPSDENYTSQSFTKYVTVLAKYQSNLNHPNSEDEDVDNEQNAFHALRNIAQALVWADQQPSKSNIWDLFLELAVMNLFVKCLRSSSQYSSIESRYARMRYQSNFLRTLSIIIQSITREQSLYSLFSSNYINEIIEFEFEFQNEEILGYYISALKSISLKLNSSMLQFFYDPKTQKFPIFTSIISFFDHPESMTRIVVRNITLNIFNIPNTSSHIESVLQNTSYFPSIFNYMKTLFGSVARALELILDDGIEIPRNRKRTGIFRKKVRPSDVSLRLAEIEHILLYLNDLFEIQSPILKNELKKLISSTLFAPLFRPIASRASLDVNTSQVLTPFDAAARVSLFTFMVNHVGGSPGLMKHILSEMSRPNRAFNNRSILNGLKAMISDLEGTEKVSYIALKAVEAVVSAKSVSPHFLHSLQLGFETGDYAGNDGNGIEGHTTPSASNSFNGVERIGSFPESIADDEPVLMTLTDFEAPLTPFVSLPSTPKTSDSNLQPSSPFPQSPRVDGDVEPPNTNALKKSTHLDADETMNEEDILNLFKSGDTPMKDTISAALLVVRRKEARSFRLVETISKVLEITAVKASTHVQVMEIVGQIVEVLASSLKEYLKHPKISAQLIDEAFQSYHKASLNSNNCTNGHVLSEIIFTSEDLARTAFGGAPSKRQPLVASSSSSARQKSQLFSEEAFTPPVEFEDALVLYMMVQTFEKLYVKAYERDGLGWESEMHRVLGNGGEEEDISYEVKKDKLIELADIALKTHSST